MKKHLASLEFIASQIEKEIKRPVAKLLPKKQLERLRLLRHLRSDILEITDVYESDRIHFKLK